VDHARDLVQLVARREAVAVLITQTTVLGTHTPVLGTHTPVLDTHTPVLDTQTPVLNTPTRVFGRDLGDLGQLVARREAVAVLRRE